MPNIVGQRLPPLTLARIEFDAVARVPLERFLLGRRVLMFAVTGAFTPVCSESHVPGYIASAPALKSIGYSEIVCICPNDPWVTAAWAEAVDPGGVLTFLSDGNLELSRALGCLTEGRAVFVGRRPRRFVLSTKDAVVERFSVESKGLVLTCTRAQDVILAA